ncbi:DUF1348 family protein [Thiomicrorhabdus sp.]|uniref:DUF1348 family protein n=1 Tax=Thiomicrorhabdus sp. TaxID=2039724 RepID=UPI0029C815BC|nr:DUF1348 family protein [Thiomicrorhabdus sp.]
MEIKMPVPPFEMASAQQKVRMAEDAWNSRDPERVALVYTEDTQWRNRTEFPRGREAVKEFLTRKWHKEKEYRPDQRVMGISSESHGGEVCLRVA